MSINFFTELIRDRYKDRNNIPYRSDKSRILARNIVRNSPAKNNHSVENEYAETVMNDYDIKCMIEKRDSEYNSYILNNPDSYLNETYKCVA